MEIDLDQLRRVADLKHAEHHRLLGSTSDSLLVGLQTGDILPPALIVADEQTHGRGRGQNRWWSQRGGLTFSLAIEVPTPTRAGWRPISLYAGMAVAEVVEAALPGENVRVKWPNDVMLNDRKVCGILVETTGRTGEVAVVGIGLNVNTDLRLAPPEVAASATSMAAYPPHEFHRGPLLVKLVERLLIAVQQMATPGYRLDAAWEPRCFLRGRRVRVQAGNQVYEGLCHGIAEDGALLLFGDDSLQHVYAGTVLHFGPPV